MLSSHGRLPVRSSESMPFQSMPNTFSSSIRTASTSALAAFFSLGMLVAPVNAQSIDTLTGWGGAGVLPGSIQTYGQTISAPSLPAVLRGFEFMIWAPAPNLQLRFYVYEWDPVNNAVTGQALYRSPTPADLSHTGYEREGAIGLNVPLHPGKQYVLIGSAIEVPWSPSTSPGRWGLNTSPIYQGGMFLYTEDSRPWTDSWDSVGDTDLAFTANIEYVDLPAAPSLSLASRGDGQATFTVNLSDPGSAALKHFTVGCIPQGGGSTVSATKTNSPVTVSGLTNGTTYDCSATATNQDEWAGPSSAPVSVTPISAPAITDPGALLTGRINQSYSLTLQATGGLAPYSWSAIGLPADLTIDPATGIINGTPTAAATSQITVTVTDDAGQVKSAQFTIVVDPLDLTVSTQTLPGGQIGQAYNAGIVVAGGVPPYSFTLTGDLPEGLTLNPTTGAITGTPTKAQTSTFSVTIEDSTLLPQSAMAKAAVHSVTHSFSITVAAAPVMAAPTPVPTLGEWGVIALSSLLAVFGLVRSRRRQG